MSLAPLAAAYYRQPQVAELLSVQALIFLATPFTAIPEVLLMRAMDFRRQALVNIAATLVSATVALGCAFAGLGVWTLVWAPVSLFWARAVGLQAVTRARYRPSLRFAGTGPMFRFGLALLASSFGWTVMTQADTAIAARWLSPGQLGLYAEAFFLTSLIASKFVPSLNEVFYPAYARMQDDPRQLGAAFLKAVRLIMLVTCPLYLGLSVVAPDAITLVLGAKVGRDGAIGDCPGAGDAGADAAHPVRAGGQRARPHPDHHALVPVRRRGHARGVLRRPALGRDGPRLRLAAGVSAAASAHVRASARQAWHRRAATGGRGRARPAGKPGDGRDRWLLGRQLGGVAPWQRLLLEVAGGGAAYVGLLSVFSRSTVMEVAALITRRRATTRRRSGRLIAFARVSMSVV